MAGYEERYEEHTKIGPDGKPVKKVSIIRHELSDAEEKKLREEIFADLERTFMDFDGSAFGPGETFWRMMGRFRSMFSRSSGKEKKSDV